MERNKIIWQNEVLEMAEQAGFTPVETSWHFSTIEAFAKLVEERTAAKEREACAKVCDEYAGEDYDTVSDILSKAIRARGEA